MATRKAASSKDLLKTATAAKTSRTGVSRQASATDETPTPTKARKAATTTQTTAKSTKTKARQKAVQSPIDDSDREPIKVGRTHGYLST